MASDSTKDARPVFISERNKRTAQRRDLTAPADRKLSGEPVLSLYGDYFGCQRYLVAIWCRLTSTKQVITTANQISLQVAVL